MPDDNLSAAEAALDAAGLADPHLAALRQVFPDPEEYQPALVFARLHLPARDNASFLPQALWLQTTLFIQLHQAKPDADVEMKAICADALTRIAIAEMPAADAPGGRTQ